MTRKNNIKALSLATGTALALGLASSNVMADTSNPFAMTDLSQGYQVSMSSDKTEEGKCGGSKTTASEAKCGEGKCGGSKTKATEGKCGEGKTKAPEAKCGEGKCGGSK